MKEDTLWSLIGATAAVSAAVLARRAAGRAYRKATDRDPPTAPDRDDTGWREAIAWGAATGMLVGVVRVVGRSAGRKALAKTRGQRRLARLKR
ncbi:DUF4235 domain-containing protein [Halomonas sp. V046]|mgnify:CR=1 FL=1|uniref:DUF4235 domain-containing protein n=1 Tax=Halomonas sp. V046 TaxID=3459611 RepID=UPI0040439D47